jgi:hypothetical protein
VRQLSEYQQLIEGIALKFVNPEYQPDWMPAEDQPPWDTNTEAQRAVFKSYVNAQLDELERRIRAERIAQLEADETLPETIRQLADGVQRGFAIAHVRVEDFKALHPGATVNDLIKWERRMIEQRETGKVRRGPTKADPGEQANHSTVLAAFDVRRMRYVIFPRFWGRKNRTSKPTAEEIAAERHNAPLSAVQSRINKSKGENTTSISRNSGGN